MKKYSYIFKVDKEDIDFNGHVGNVRYLSWMIDAATSHSESVGYGYESCRKLDGTWVAKSHRIEYKKPAFEGDELRMETWIDSIGKVLSKRKYLISRPSDNTVICEGETEWVFVDTKRMRPFKVPAEIIEAFKE